MVSHSGQIGGGYGRPTIQTRQVTNCDKLVLHLNLASGPVVEPGPRRGPSERFQREESPKSWVRIPPGPCHPFPPTMLIDEAFGGFKTVTNGWEYPLFSFYRKADLSGKSQ